MSYGKLSNSHLIQKYGFTEQENAHNQVTLNAPYHDYTAIVNEESGFKEELRSKFGFPQSTVRMPLSLYKGRFNQESIRQMRLNFLTSKNVMDFTPTTQTESGTEHFLEHETFKDPFDPSNEQLTFQFLTKSLESSLSKLKPRDFYLSRIGDLESNIDSLDSYHLLNVYRLHLDEYDILKGNLDYLSKTVTKNIKSLYIV